MEIKEVDKVVVEQTETIGGKKGMEKLKWIIELNKMIAYCRYRALLTNNKIVKDK